jgi:outer membrane protein assembly factor BamB
MCLALRWAAGTITCRARARRGRCVSVCELGGSRNRCALDLCAYGRPAAGGAAFADERDGRPTLTERWTSREIVAPAAPAVANGLVFALATGNAGSTARLHILDAATGNRVFSSRDAVRGVAHPATGLAVANGRVYFSTMDNTVYCFGIPTEH